MNRTLPANRGDGVLAKRTWSPVSKTNLANIAQGKAARVLKILIAYAAAACLLQTAAANSQAKSDGHSRPVSIEDIIEWNDILPFSWVAQTGLPTDAVLWSPDRSKFLVRTRHGDLRTDKNIESLLLFDARQLDQNLVSANGSVQPLLIRSFELDGAQTLGSLRWLDSNDLGLIAPDTQGIAQAYKIDIGSRELTQLTRSPTDILSFALQSGAIVYLACSPAKSVASTTGAVTLSDTENFQAYLPHPANERCGSDMDLFAGSPPASVRKISEYRSHQQVPQLLNISISPSGRYAILLGPAVDAPSYWADYQIPDYERWGFKPEKRESDPTSPNLLNKYRYMLVDLKQGIVRPLLDAPSGILAFNLTPPKVFWRESENTVLVSNTFLPLDGVTPSERVRRTKGPAIAEVSLGDGTASAISWEASTRLAPAPIIWADPAVLDLSWDANRNILQIVRRYGKARVRMETFRTAAGKWSPAGSIDYLRDGDATTVFSEEDLNSRPMLHARIRGQEFTVFDPNPKAETLTFGSASVVQWTDSMGTTWKAGLLLPPGFIAGKRYPLVVQTHGFDEKSFMLEGVKGGHTAFAAQALAAAGLIVLQVQDNPNANTGDASEGKRVAEGYRAGIEALVERGLVDPSKVGLVAFSRTGYHAINLLASYPTLVSTVSISDSYFGGYLNYLLGVNTPYAQDETIRLTGGSPLPAELAEWIQKNPLYKIARSSASFRFEENGPSGALGMWEAYSILRAAGRPVDFTLYPNGDHVLQRPRERLSSQGGTVDWMRFWLQGYEAPDAEKVDQYARWRKQREQEVAKGSR